MDYYNLNDDWQKFKIEIKELEEYVYNFKRRPASRKWCASTRKKSKNIEAFGIKIKKNITKQRQDIDSDYS